MPITPKPKTLLELFEGHPERWCQGAFARNADGDPMSIEDVSNGCAWCLSGAILLVYGNSFEAREPVIQRLDKAGPFLRTVWNDQRGRTHADIVELVRTAGV